jgi:hypothetical protein
MVIITTNTNSLLSLDRGCETGEKKSKKKGRRLKKKEIKKKKK